jgi:hypothetical protein
MRYAISINDEIVLLKPQHLDAMKHQRNIIKEGMWTEAELNAVGIYQITDGTFDPFALKRTGFTLELIDNKAVETITTEDIPLKEIKERELNTVFAEYEASMEPIKLGYPKSEQETQGRQETQALAYQADNSAITPFLTKLVETKNIKNPLLTKAELAQKILDKVAIFEVLAGELTGLKQNKQEAIGDAKNAQEVRDATQ